MNNSGKTLTIFLIVIAVLLICLTGISVFFFVQEIELRKAAEVNVEQLQISEAKLRADYKEAEKQIALLEGKAKEAETKIDDLMEEVSLEQELKEEVKRDSRQLKEKIDQEIQAKEELRKQLSDELALAQEKIQQVEKELDQLKNRNKELESIRQDLESQIEQLKNAGDAGVSGGVSFSSDDPGTGVDLAPIVINTSEEKKGAVVSVDVEADFLIVSLGEKQGIKKGMQLSIYRGKDYLGDVTVSRVLPEMSAADFVAPLTSKEVQKDDQVIIKE